MLKAQRRISRKELKEDPLITYVIRVQNYFEIYFKQIAYAVLGVITVIVLGYMMYSSKKEAEAAALSEVSKAELYYANGQYEQVKPQFQKIIDDYGGTRGAGKATYFLANIYYLTGDLDEAERYFRQYIDDYADYALLILSAYEGLGNCSEDRQKYDRAIEFYQEAYTKYPTEAATPQLLLDIGRCHEAKSDYAAARTIYQQLLNQFPDSPYTESAQAGLALISLK